MKKMTTQNISLSLIFALILVVGFATAGYSDSFVDENTLKALDNFTFGHSTQADSAVTHNTDRVAFKGDSFVDANAIEALKDFRFGFSADAKDADATAQAESTTFKGDSFVNASVIRQLDGFVFLKGFRVDTVQL